MQKYFAVLLLLLVFDAFEATETNLWDLVVKQEQVFLTVEHQGRYLNVWRQNVSDYFRYYVTPLCIMDLESISCSRDEYADVHRHVFEFDIKLWDWKAAKAVKIALKRKNVIVNAEDILPLPMHQIRIGLRRKDLKLEIDHQWRSNQDQPHRMPFELYVRHQAFCDKMVTEAKDDLKQFLRRTKLYFEFNMIAGQQSSRKFNISGSVLQKSSFFNKLLNKNSNNGIVYLQSKDINRLTHDIFNIAAFEEEMTADYIQSDQEHEIISEILNIFKQKILHSNELSKEEWNSVFWDNIFSRPDIQTEHFNQVLNYNKAEKQFKYDKEEDKKFHEKIEAQYEMNDSGSGGGGIFGKGNILKGFFAELETGIGGYGASNSSSKNETKNDSEKNEKNILKFDDFQKLVNNEEINVKWTGEKFEPKNLNLYRLNLKELNISNQIYFRRIVVKKYHTTQKIEIKAEPKNHSKSIFEQLSIETTTPPPVTCPPMPKCPPSSTCPPPTICLPHPMPELVTCPPTIPTVKPSPAPTCPPPITCPKPCTKCPALNNEKCPENFVYLPATNACYAIASTISTWQNAAQNCRNLKSQLTSIHNADELHLITCIHECFQNNYPDTTLWIGAHTTNGGEWLWSDNTVWDYNPWGNEYHDIYSCGAINSKSGLFDKSCTQQQKTVCKFPL